MLRNIFLLALILLFCGCSSAVRVQYPEDLILQKKDIENAEKMSQIFGNKYEATLLLDTEELDFALKYPEYFAESVKYSGFDAVAIPFADSCDADIETERGRKICDFVIFLNSKSLKTFYLLRESFYINRRKGREFVRGNGNPYRNTLLNLKQFWKELPESAEMPTVIIALEMNRWNDRNLDRPAGMLMVWRDYNKNTGSPNDCMFTKSMHSLVDCRKILDLEQMVLLLDGEVVESGEQGWLTGGRIVDLLEKCDALAIDFVSDKAVTDIDKRLSMLKKVKEQGSVFIVCTPAVENISTYPAWLGYLQNWQNNTGKISGCAGLWVRNWKKLNMIWRNEK